MSGKTATRFPGTLRLNPSSILLNKPVAAYACTTVTPASHSPPSGRLHTSSDIVMGQHHTTNHGFSPVVQPTHQSLGYVLFDLLGLFCGPEYRQLHVNLPICWDELIDWTEQVTTLTSLLSIETIMPGQSTNGHFLLDRDHSLCFVPLILRQDTEKVRELKWMSWLSRARFFAGSVVISITRANETLGYLSLGQFCQCHSLLCRFSDLYVLKFETTSKAESANPPCHTRNECLLCYSETENAILSCGHALCVNCESRWVKRQLACPFCREKFRSAKDINRNGTWDLTEWPDCSDLDHDIRILESKLEEFWRDALAATGSSVCLRRGLYTQVPRSLAVIEDDSDDFLLIEEHEGLESLALTI